MNIMSTNVRLSSQCGIALCNFAIIISLCLCAQIIIYFLSLKHESLCLEDLKMSSQHLTPVPDWLSYFKDRFKDEDLRCFPRHSRCRLGITCRKGIVLHSKCFIRHFSNEKCFTRFYSCLKNKNTIICSSLPGLPTDLKYSY